MSPASKRATVVLCCAIFQFVELNWLSRIVNRIVCQTSETLCYCGRLLNVQSPGLQGSFEASCGNQVWAGNKAAEKTAFLLQHSQLWWDKPFMADKYGLFLGLVVSVEHKGVPTRLLTTALRSLRLRGRCPLHTPVSRSWLILCKDAQPVTEIPLIGAGVQRHFHSCFNTASICSSDSGDPERRRISDGVEDLTSEWRGEIWASWVILSHTFPGKGSIIVALPIRSLTWPRVNDLIPVADLMSAWHVKQGCSDKRRHAGSKASEGCERKWNWSVSQVGQI